MDDSKIKDFSFENLFFWVKYFLLLLLFYTLFLRHGIEMWTFGYNKKKSMLEKTVSLFDDSCMSLGAGNRNLLGYVFRFKY
jgi:hypothetical protein